MMNEKNGSAVVLAEKQKVEMTSLIRGVMSAGIFTEDIPETAVEAACALAVGLGLDVVSGHVRVHTARQTTGSRERPNWVQTHSPYLTGPGMAAWAAKFPQFRGYRVRPLSQQEKEMWLIDAPLAVEVTMYRDDWRDNDNKMIPITGIGTADPANPYRNNPVERTHPRDMAEWRGLRRVIIRGFPPDTVVARALMAHADIPYSSMEDTRDVVEEVVEKVVKSPPPHRIPDDQWKGFYVQMTEWGVPHDKVHDLLEDAGVAVTGGDPEGKLERSVRHTGLNPQEAAEMVRRIMMEKGLSDPAQPALDR